MGWGTLAGIVWRLVRGVSGSAVGDTADRLLGRLSDLQAAQSEVERAEIERDITQLKMIHDLQKPQAARWWSPMQLGQYLIVLPFGAWWASVCFVSIGKPLLVEGRWAVDDLPPHIFDMAWWLLPLALFGTMIGSRK